MAATSPELASVTGRYFRNLEEKRPSARALDDGMAKRLWEVSERLTGLVPGNQDDAAYQ